MESNAALDRENQRLLDAIDAATAAIAAAESTAAAATPAATAVVSTTSVASAALSLAIPPSASPSGPSAAPSGSPRSSAAPARLPSPAAASPAPPSAPLAFPALLPPPPASPLFAPTLPPARAYAFQARDAAFIALDLDAVAARHPATSAVAKALREARPAARYHSAPRPTVGALLDETAFARYRPDECDRLLRLVTALRSARPPYVSPPPPPPASPSSRHRSRHNPAQSSRHAPAHLSRSQDGPGLRPPSPGVLPPGALPPGARVTLAARAPLSAPALASRHGSHAINGRALTRRPGHPTFRKAGQLRAVNLGLPHPKIRVSVEPPGGTIGHRSASKLWCPQWHHVLRIYSAVQVVS
ncbi:unnamed protein product [Pylaiella littoralis]